MYVYRCLLVTQGNLYYATREHNAIHETGDHIHNFALTFALGFTSSPYKVGPKPDYERDLAPVTMRGIYVTPATPRRIRFTTNSTRFAGEHNHSNMKERPAWRKDRNYPDYYQVKSIATESEFSFYILSTAPIVFPQWIRMGLWATKCEVQIEGEGYLDTIEEGVFVYRQALNPLDLDTQTQFPEMPSIIAMPPTSLIHNARLDGKWLKGALNTTTGIEEVVLPANMKYLQQDR